MNCDKKWEDMKTNEKLEELRIRNKESNFMTLVISGFIIVFLGLLVSILTIISLSLLSVSLYLLLTGMSIGLFIGGFFIIHLTIKASNKLREGKK